MSLFKSKEEKRIEAEMQRDESLQIFTEKINTLKAKREEYAKLAAEAEINGDDLSAQTAINALCSLNEMISSLQQTKSNFDLINLTNSVAVDMSVAAGLLCDMASQKAQVPNIRKVQKTSLKLAQYMRQVQISQKAMSNMLKNNNPANRARTEAEIAAVRPMIEAAKDKISSTQGLSSTRNMSSTSDIDELLNQVQKERDKIID